MSNKTLTPIVVNTDVLSGVVDDILAKLNLDRSSKSALLNEIAARISGPKHNWGYLTSATEVIIANGVANQGFTIEAQERQQPAFPDYKFTEIGPKCNTLKFRSTVSPGGSNAFCGFIVERTIGDEVFNFCVSHTDIVRANNNIHSAEIHFNGTDFSFSTIRRVIPSEHWQVINAHVEEWIEYAKDHTCAGDTISDAFFQMLDRNHVIPKDEIAAAAEQVLRHFYERFSEGFDLINTFMYEGARTVYSVIEEDYANLVTEIEDYHKTALQDKDLKL